MTNPTRLWRDYLPPAGQLLIMCSVIALAVTTVNAIAPRPAAPEFFWAFKPILLAVLLCVPVVLAPAFLGAGLVVSLATAALLGVHVSVYLVLINIVEVVTIAVVLRRAVGVKPDLANPTTFYLFLLVAILGAPAVTALPAALCLSQQDGTPYLYAVQTRYVSDAIGMLVLAPAALAVLRGDLVRLADASGILARAALLAALLAVAAGVFTQSRYPLLFLIPPPLILFAARAGAPGLFLAMPILAAIELYGTSRGHGPIWLAGRLGPAERMAMELAFLGACVAIGRFSAAAAAAQSSTLEELRAANERLKIAAECGGVGVWEWEAQDDRLSWDDRMAMIYGVPRQAAPRHVAEWAERVHSQDRAAVEEKLAAVRKGARRLDAEFRILRGDGAVRHIHASGLVMRRDTDGRPTQILGINWDVTARAQALAEVHESEERLRLLIGGVREHSVYLLDPSGKIASWNPGAERITGYGEAEMVGRDVGCLFPAEARASGHPARILAEASEHGHWEGEGWRVRKDGSQFLARIVLTARRDADGRLRGFTKIAHDLSERKMQEAQRATIIESAPAGMMIVDDHGIITLANSHAEALFGYARGALTGVAVDQLVPEGRRAKLSRLRQAYSRSSGQAMSHNRAMSLSRQFDGLRHGGKTVSVEVLLNRVSTPHGNITVVTVLDASERRRRAEERMRAEAVERAEAAATQARLEQLARYLEQARDQAQQANEAKSRFLAGITHELRTPLNGILGYAQLLRLDGGLSAQQDAYVDSMLGAGEHLVGMINAVLDLSQIEADRLELVPVSVNLKALAQSCLDLVRPSAQAKSLSLHLHVQDAAPKRLIADKTRLRQVLVNLLGNAVKFTRVGGVTLRILPGAASGVRLEVADTGPGIPLEQSSWLFQEFSRLPGDAVGAVEGSGLGLAITARLVQRMGGSIDYRDSPGGGTVFCVELPSLGVEAPAVTPESSSIGPPHLQKRLRVLVVDDDPTNRAIAAAMLRHAGHIPTVAEDGTIAVSMAGSEDYDVILMDVRMPGIDGLEAVRRIRRLPSRRGEVPVVALTAQAFANQIERCYAAGMDDHLSKPLEHSTLIAVLARVTADRTPAGPGKPDLHSGDNPEDGFDEIRFLATRNLLPPESFSRYLSAVAADCDALQIRLSKPDALADMAGLVDDVHKAGSSAGAMGMFRLAAVAKRFEYAAETSAPDMTAHVLELAGELSGVTSKLFSLSGSI